MPFKRSFFNPTLFRKNLSRSWPLWGGITMVGSLFPLYLILNMMNYGFDMKRSDFVTVLAEATVNFLPAFTCFYAGLVTMFVWAYLHNARAVGMMHSLSVDRTNLFITNTLSGLSMLLIPYVVVGGLLCVIAAFCGAMDIGTVLLTVAAVLLESVLFFSMGTLCAAVTGNIYAAPVFYVVLNFAAPVLDLLINSLAQEFIFGLTGNLSKAAIYLSPVVSLYENIEAVYWADEVRMTVPRIEGYFHIVIYGLVGLLLLALSWLLYRKRRSESAGDVVAFPILRPIFRLGVSIACALTLGRVLYEMFWASLFQQGDYADIVPMGICMAVTAVLGFYAANMFLHKTLRVFRGSLKGVAAVCAVTVLICAAVSVDLFGVERYVPEKSEVKSIELDGNLYLTCDGDSMTLLLDDILSLHAAIIEEREYIKSFDQFDYNSVSWNYTDITYTLRDGSTVEREYQLPISEARCNDPSTYDGKFFALTVNPDALLATIAMPKGGAISNMYLDFYDCTVKEWNYSTLSSLDYDVIYRAVEKDAREGNFSLDFMGSWDKESGVDTSRYYLNSPSLNIDFIVRGEVGSPTFSHAYITLQPTMKHTLAALRENGLITAEIEKGWME